MIQVRGESCFKEILGPFLERLRKPGGWGTYTSEVNGYIYIYIYIYIYTHIQGGPKVGIQYIV